MRLILITVFLLAPLLLTASAFSKQRKTDSQDLSDLLDRVRTSVVQVEARFPGGAVATGTGFFINENGVVVTARHVTHPLNGVVPQMIRVRLRVPTSEGPVLFVVATWSSFPAKEIGQDEAHDIAILKTEQNPFTESGTLIKSYTQPGKETSLKSPKPTVASIYVHRLKDGEPVFVSGYPLSLPILITGSGIIASSDPSTFERPPGQTGAPLRILDIYWADVRVNAGDSGGPLFSAISGSVIGLIHGYADAPVKFADSQDVGIGVTKQPNGVELFRPLTHNSGIAIVVPARYIVDLLQHLGVKYQATEK